jgi:hypothetical protein
MIAFSFYIFFYISQCTKEKLHFIVTSIRTHRANIETERKKSGPSLKLDSMRSNECESKRP